MQYWSTKKRKQTAFVGRIFAGRNDASLPTFCNSSSSAPQRRVAHTENFKSSKKALCRPWDGSCTPSCVAPFIFSRDILIPRTPLPSPSPACHCWVTASHRVRVLKQRQPMHDACHTAIQSDCLPPPQRAHQRIVDVIHSEDNDVKEIGLNTYDSDSILATFIALSAKFSVNARHKIDFLFRHSTASCVKACSVGSSFHKVFGEWYTPREGVLVLRLSYLCWERQPTPTLYIY